MEVEEKEKRREGSKIAKVTGKRDKLEAKMALLEKQRLQVEALKKLTKVPPVMSKSQNQPHGTHAHPPVT